MIQEEEKKDEIDHRVRLFHKVGGYYKWSWKEFKETPYWVVKQLAKLLDENRNDLSKFIGYEEYSEYRNLLRLHGRKDDKK